MNIRSNLGMVLLVGALMLSACGGAPAAPAATSATAVPPAAAQPTAAFEAVTDTSTEPTVGAAKTDSSGALAWRDHVLRNDAVTISITGLASLPTGQAYAAWLATTATSLPLGALTTGENDSASLAFAAPEGNNLLGTYERIFITKGPLADATTKPGTVALGGALPAQALVPIRQILVSADTTPDKIGFALGLRQETDELLRHAQFLRDAYDANDFALERVHSEHIINIIRGSEARDANGDGKLQNPGDGYGLLANGQQDGYIKGMIDQAKLAAAAPDATAAIKLHAGHVQITGENTRQRVDQIRALAEQVIAASDRAATTKDVLAIVTLAEQTIEGADLNLDEQVGPIPGEGGVITAYQHSQLMASLPLAVQATTDVVPTPAAGAAAPTTAPAVDATAPAANPPPPTPAKTVAISIGDNSFAPKKLTVAVGTTVVWQNVGKRPHTITADNGAFVSGNMDAGVTFRQTFTKAGTFPYYCEYHGGAGGQGMAATIIVTDGAAAKPPLQAAPTAAPAATAPAPTAPPATQAFAVEIGDNSFTQKAISIPVGATVTWTSVGQKPHTVTADDGSFTSATLKNGGTFSHTFDKPGVYAYYCTFHGGAGGQGMAGVVKVGETSSAQPVPPPAPAPAPAGAMVEIGDNRFNQKEISIPVGTTVMWMSSGQKPHTVTADDGTFTSDTLKNGDMFSHTFDKPGVYRYYCTFHGGPNGQGMAGVVKVDEAAQAAQPAPTASAAAAPTVSMKDFAFEPAEMHIKVGQRMTWKNDGEKRHSATAVDGSFDTGLFGKGEAKTVQFNTPGTFRYFCQLHGAQDGTSGMVATIIVDP